MRTGRAGNSASALAAQTGNAAAVAINDSQSSIARF
jgi:hypothetical protein